MILKSPLIISYACSEGPDQTSHPRNLVKAFAVCLYILEYQVTHYENMPIQIYWKFYDKKNENFQIKKFW